MDKQLHPLYNVGEIIYLFPNFMSVTFQSFRRKERYQSVSEIFTQCSTLQIPLEWRHNEHDGVSNHQAHQCLLNFTGDRWIPHTNGQ